MGVKATTTVLLFLNTVLVGLNCTVSVLKANSALPIVACLNAFAAGIMFKQLGIILTEEKIKKEEHKLYEEAAKNILEELRNSKK